ncbi:hypothetical protein ACLOJK_000330 [Asimina triloba]
MASRFWTQGDSDSEELTGSEDEVETSSRPSESTNAVTGSRYSQGNASDGDDSDGRIVCSVRDKWLEMSANVDHMKNVMKIHDWVSLQESFDNIKQQLEKVIEALVMLEDFLAQTLANKEASNTNALNSMKLQLKKHNKQFEDLIRRYRENPENKDEEQSYAQEDNENEEDDDGRDGQIEHGSGWEKKMNKENKLMDRQLMKDPSEITWDTIDKKSKEIIAARGRKSTGRL